MRMLRIKENYWNIQYENESLVKNTSSIEIRSNNPEMDVIIKKLKKRSPDTIHNVDNLPKVKDIIRIKTHQ